MLRVRPAISWVFSALSLVLATSASAQELSPAPGLSGPVGPAPEREGARVHDGFYLRLAAGFGVFDERLQSGDLENGGSIEARNRGMSSLTDLAIGGTVARGWVIGGVIYASDLIASTLRISEAGAVLPAELDAGLRSVSLIGPFVDWYPHPSEGLHVRLTLGLATLTPRLIGHPATQRSEYLAVGGGLALGVGYDWWVADEWSIGVMSQLGAAFLKGKDDSDVDWTHIVTISPGLFVCLTYH